MSEVVRISIYDKYKSQCKNDEKCKISIQDVDKSARVLCQALANASGLSNGEVISESIWKAAQKRYHPRTIKDILELEGIGYEID